MVKGSGAGRRGKKPHGNPAHYQFDTRSLMKDLANKREQDMGREPQTERDYDGCETAMPPVRSMVDVFGILKYFAWEHLPAHLQEVSKPFYMVALDVAERWVDGADEDETNMALRKLLEAKDAAVRAAVKP